MQRGSNNDNDNSLATRFIRILHFTMYTFFFSREFLWYPHRYSFLLVFLGYEYQSVLIRTFFHYRLHSVFDLCALCLSYVNHIFKVRTVRVLFNNNNAMVTRIYVLYKYAHVCSECNVCVLVISNKFECIIILVREKCLVAKPNLGYFTKLCL